MSIEAMAEPHATGLTVAPVPAWSLTAQELANGYPDGVLAFCDLELRFVVAGGGGLVGVGLDPAALGGRTVLEALPPEPARTITAGCRSVLAGEDEAVLDLSYEGRSIRVRIAASRSGSGHVVGCVIAARDLTEFREQEEHLRAAEEQFRSAFDNAPIGMALVAFDGSFLKVNTSLCEILGYGADALLATTFQAITHPDDLAADLDNLEQLRAGHTSSYRMEKRYFDARGRTVHIQLSVTMVRGVHGAQPHYIAQIEDISERKRREEELTRLAQRDALTGLMNRSVLEDDLARHEHAAERYGDTCVVMVIDLDGFKNVNDQGGHGRGDEVLRAVARALEERLRVSDRAYRLGGDEFAVLLPHATLADAEVVAASVTEVIAGITVQSPRGLLRVTASIGVAELTGSTRGSALAEADSAMYVAKRRAARRGALAAGPVT